MLCPGMKVRCVDNIGAPMLSLGDVYTVASVMHHPGCVGITLIEADPNELGDGWYIGFLADRFRPIVERKTDVSIFRAMLNPSLEDLREIIRENANAEDVR